jgi:acyl dehydratase
MLVPLWSELLEVDSVTTKVNYGLNKVRFPAPVPAGSKIRATVTLRQLEPVAGGAQLTIEAVIEREGGEKPVCVAEAVLRFYE